MVMGMANCQECVHKFVCETLKGKIKNSWAETCVAYRHRETCVAVVRCEDCKHSYMGVANLMCGRCGQNINGIRLGGVSVKAEHYCSYGERRNDVSIND